MDDQIKKANLEKLQLFNDFFKEKQNNDSKQIKDIFEKIQSDLSDEDRMDMLRSLVNLHVEISTRKEILQAIKKIQKEIEGSKWK